MNPDTNVYPLTVLMDISLWSPPNKAAASPTEVLSGVALTTEGAPHGACLPPCYPPCAVARDSVEGLPLWSVIVGVHVVWMWPNHCHAHHSSRRRWTCGAMVGYEAHVRYVP